jgi:hypothetical protein
MRSIPNSLCALVCVRALCAPLKKVKRSSIAALFTIHGIEESRVLAHTRNRRIACAGTLSLNITRNRRILCYIGEF